jgi:nucleoside-diphosphate-sugar epimerase
LRVVIPGASGFIGRNLLNNAPQDWDVVATYNADKSFPFFVNNLRSKRVTAEKCDLLDPQDLHLLQKRCGDSYDLGIYLAANSDPSKSSSEPLFDLRSNVEGLIDFLRMFKVKKLIFFSSGAVYEGLDGMVSPEKHVAPTLPYAISKLAAEAYVKHFRKTGTISEYLIVRFFGAYGPYESSRKIYSRLVNQFHIERKKDFPMRGKGLNLIDAMYVDDAVEGILRMVCAPLEDTVIDFCGGNPMAIRELILKAAEIFGITQPKIVQEGETVEYNKFYANPLPFIQRYDYKPKIDLKEGFLKLAKFLEANQK